MRKIQAVKGMNDLFAEELVTWRFIERRALSLFGKYGFEEIRTPILEELALFVRGVGEHTDIVEKEMYALSDISGKTLCLRPENTAGIVRALVEKNLFTVEPELKVCYIGPMFRRERPQKGRLRQFHQIGAEAFGWSGPLADVEIIAMLWHFFEEMQIKNTTLLLNSLGEAHERLRYHQALYAYLKTKENELCPDCLRRMEKNVLRVLDCKNPVCKNLLQEAPKTIDFLEEESRTHFEALTSHLKQLKIPFLIAPNLVRGLDYYTRTVFELVSEEGLGSQNTLAAGGRYDKLVQELGGPQVPAVGFSIGLERLILLLQQNEKKNHEEKALLSFIAADTIGRRLAFDLCMHLRKRNIFAEFDLQQKSLKAQMRQADRRGAQAVIVLGERESQTGLAEIKMLKNKKIFPVYLTAEALEQSLHEIFSPEVCS